MKIINKNYTNRFFVHHYFHKNKNTNALRFLFPITSPFYHKAIASSQLSIINKKNLKEKGKETLHWHLYSCWHLKPRACGHQKILLTQSHSQRYKIYNVPPNSQHAMTTKCNLCFTLLVLNICSIVKIENSR